MHSCRCEVRAAPGQLNTQPLGFTSVHALESCIYWTLTALGLYSLSLKTMTSILKAPTSKSPAVIKQLSSFKQVTRGLGTTYLSQLTCLLHFHGSGWGSTGCAGRVTHPLCSQHPRLDCCWPWGESCDLAVVYCCVRLWDILPLSPDCAGHVACAIIFSRLTTYSISYCGMWRNQGPREKWLAWIYARRTQGLLCYGFQNLCPGQPHPILHSSLPCSPFSTPPDFRALFLCIVELFYFQCPFSELCCLF